MKQHLHIVAFDIPCPPNYGGVIDIYYKILNLHRMGTGVILHTFQYHRKPHKDLERICEKVYYYKRKTGFLSFMSCKPYIVNSRRSKELLHNLCQDSFPILFEGLHTCYHLDDPLLAARRKIYRESNIEHHYYSHLAKAEKNILKKPYYHFESMRLERFESVLSHATDILTVSEDDTQYLAGKFPDKNPTWLPSFHEGDTITSSPGSGTYVLYQGKLSVPENEAAAIHIIQQIYNDDLPELIIAGMNPSKKLRSMAASRPNVRLISNPDQDEMDRLIHEAHINLMVTFQPTGLKLKLLKALFNGRFLLVNPEMLAGTGLDSLCHIASTPEEFRAGIRNLFMKSFTEKEIEDRKSNIPEAYSNAENTRKLIRLIDGDF